MTPPTDVDFLIARQHAVARNYALARELYAKYAGIYGCARFELSVASSLELLQTDAAEGSLHIRWALGIDPHCSCCQMENVRCEFLERGGQCTKPATGFLFSRRHVADPGLGQVPLCDTHRPLMERIQAEIDRTIGNE